jgi:hypothetical protein
VDRTLTGFALALRRARLVTAGLACCGAFAGCSAGGGSSDAESAARTVAAARPAAGAATSETPAPSQTPNLPQVSALSAGAFVHGFGVNMHNAFYGTGYTNDVPLVESLVTAVGAAVVRDGMSPGQGNVCAEDAALGAKGLRFDFIATTTTTPSQIQSWLGCVGTKYVASVEGPNEYDINHPPSDKNWAKTLAAAQEGIAATVRADDPGVAVIGPAVTTASAAKALGNLSAYLDDGNAHVYFNGYNPGNTGYGEGGYGSIPYALSAVSSISGSKPMFVTETGYGTAGGVGQVSEAVQAKYMPRLMLEMAKDGVPEAIAYEFIDEGGAPFSSYGLLRSNLSLKPAYYAVQSLIWVLYDTGPTMTGTLGIGISGQTSNVASLLFRKSDGSYALALWLEVESSDPNTGQNINVSPQSVTLQFARTLLSPTLYTYDSASQFQATALAPASSFSLSVSDEVEVLKFK